MCLNIPYLNIRSIYFNILEDIIQIINAFSQGHNKLNLYLVSTYSILMQEAGNFQHLYVVLSTECLPSIEYKYSNHMSIL